MRSRSLRILLIGVFSLWFGIIVPGHERGAIRVAGSVAAGASEDGACHVAAACNSCPTAKSGQPARSPAGDPSEHCAICKFIGVLDAPVIVPFALPTIELLGEIEPPALRSIAALALLSIDRGRGPPIHFI